MVASSWWNDHMWEEQQSAVEAVIRLLRDDCLKTLTERSCARLGTPIVRFTTAVTTRSRQSRTDLQFVLLVTFAS